MKYNLGVINEYICQDPKSCVKYRQKGVLFFDFTRKKYIKNLTVFLYLKIKLTFLFKQNIIFAIIKYLDLNEILSEKINNLSETNWKLFKMSKLLSSDHKKWIIILDEEYYENKILKILLALLITRAEGKNLISIFSKKQIMPQEIEFQIDKNFEYNLFEI